MKNKELIPPASSITSIWHNPIHFIAFGFGVGVIPFAPGTFGTLLAIPFYLLMSDMPFGLYATLTGLFILLSIVICHVAAREINVHDHPGMVLDEVVGYLLTMLAAPPGWLWVIVGFVLFRIFDIWKPWPIGWVDRKVSGGFGIVLDDLLAAVYSLAILQIMAAIFFYYE